MFYSYRSSENGRIGNLKKSIEKISNVLSNQQHL